MYIIYIFQSIKVFIFRKIFILSSEYFILIEKLSCTFKFDRTLRIIHKKTEIFTEKLNYYLKLARIKNKPNKSINKQIISIDTKKSSM